jgi:hypothetical protein
VWITEVRKYADQACIEIQDFGRLKQTAERIIFGGQLKKFY